MDESTGREPMTTTIFVRHSVADYAAWRNGYDALDSMRKTMGVTNDAVYRSVENPNEVTVTHDFTTLESAQAFVGSAELKNAMSKLGVTGAPTIWFTTKA
jgi:hypothetical protein